MKTIQSKQMGFTLVFILVLPVCVWLRVAEGQGAPVENTLDTQQVAVTITRVADWPLANPARHDPRHWAMAPLYDGLIDTSLTTGDPQYLAAVIRAGRRIRFEPGPATYHADAHAAGHAWLRIYLMDPERDPELLQPFEERFDKIVENQQTDRWMWWWADALYMAPPTLGRLAQATGDKRYSRFLDAEYRVTYDGLFDPEENLFYRDTRFIDQRTPNGEKVFWSRGNAWVYAGLALLLNSLPADYPTRYFYIELFQRMSPAVLAAQQPDGHWYPSLKDPQHVPVGETSGSALFVLGLAWGVRQGLLDSATYWPVVERGWNAILTRIDSDGAVNFVQPIGAAPKVFDPASRETYGTGAVLMAGSEILRALGAEAKVEPATLLEQAEALVATAPDLSRECRQPCP